LADSRVNLVTNFKIVGNGVLDAQERPTLIGDIGQIILPERVKNPVCQMGDTVFGDVHGTSVKGEE
jgi:hypothetical protein